MKSLNQFIICLLFPLSSFCESISEDCDKRIPDDTYLVPEILEEARACCGKFYSTYDHCMTGDVPGSTDSCKYQACRRVVHAGCFHIPKEDFDEAIQYCVEESIYYYFPARRMRIQPMKVPPEGEPHYRPAPGMNLPIIAGESR